MKWQNTLGKRTRSRRCSKGGERRLSGHVRPRRAMVEALEQRQMLSWTVMFYGDYDNNLMDWVNDAFAPVAAGAGNAEVTIVAQVDLLGMGNTFRGVVEPGENLADFADAGYDPMPREQNMGDPDTFEDFLTWTITNHSADHYALIMSNHGSGGGFGSDTHTGRPTTPICLSPADKESGVGLTPELVCSSFEDANPGDTHSSTHWQVATDSGFDAADLEWNYVDAAGDMTRESIPAGTLTDPTLTYYWRARYEDSNNDWSDWSTPFSFTPVDVGSSSLNAGSSASTGDIVFKDKDVDGDSLRVDRIADRIANVLAGVPGTPEIDVLFWSACIMQNVEMAYELQDQVRYVMGSQQTAAFREFPNPLGDPIRVGVTPDLSFLHDVTDSTTPLEFVTHLCKEHVCYDTLSNVDLGAPGDLSPAIDDLARSVEDFVFEMTRNATTEDWRAAVAARENSFRYAKKEHEKKEGAEWRDLYEFAEGMRDATSVSQAVRDAAAEICDNVLEARTWNWVDDDPPTSGYGLSIRFNSSSWAEGDWSAYDYLEFYKATDWPDFVEQLNSHVSGSNLHDRFTLHADGTMTVDSYSDPDYTTLVDSNRFSVSSDSPLFLYGNAGNDDFDLSGPGWSVPTVYVEGGDGTDTVVGPDRDANWTIRSDPSGALDGSGGSAVPIGLVGIEVVSAGTGADVFGIKGTESDLTVNGGAGNDSFVVKPSTTGILTVNGDAPVLGDPGVPPGDILALDLVGVVGASVPSGVTAGVVTSTSHENVVFSSIETLIASDRFEVNDTLEQATVLGSLPKITLRDLSIHSPSDVDFFRVTAQDTGKLVINALFDNDVGNLDLAVWDGQGGIITSALSDDHNESLVIPVVSQEVYYVVVDGRDQDVGNYALEVENFPAPIPSGGFFDPASDTGRSNADNITNNNLPQMFIYADVLNFVDTNHNDTRDAGEITALTAAQATAGTTAGAAVQAWLTNTTTRTTVKGYADPLDADNPFLYSFTPAAALADGTYVVTAATWIFDGQGDAEGAPSPANARTLLSAPLLQFTVDTVAPPVSFIGIDPASTDTGVTGHPATLADRITGDTAPGFVGQTEADALVALYEKSNLTGAYAITVAVPLDGQGPFGGQWRTSYVYDLNDPIYFPLDGLRTMEARAMDVAGNLSEPATLEIFIDTQGPRVNAVKIRDDWSTDYDESTYDLFNPKGTPGGHLPTPLVTSLDIDVSDLPVRVTDFLYGALVDGDPTLDPGNYVLRGDANGIIPIDHVMFDGVAPANCQPATGTITLIFFEPLPDDRFTLTISDELVDPAGNKLDGETNAIEPQDDPSLPSGDGVPGGDFVARFTVDSRPEIGTWSAGSVYVDTNGNFSFDPDNLDYTNRDLVYVLGFTTDYIFAGNFAGVENDNGPAALSSSAIADGFDKLAAYGKVGGQARWMVDTDNDGVPNIVKVDPANIIGHPFAGNFDLAYPNNVENGDEVGLFDGITWWLDTDHNFNVDTAIRFPGMTLGFPIVGDFDGNGFDDLGTFQPADIGNGGVFTFALRSATGWFPLRTIDFQYQDFIGVRERPVAADMDGDGIDDVGLWVPDRSGATPWEMGEWYFLLSNDLDGTKRIEGQVNTLDHHFSPIPLGDDLFAQFGDEFAVPIVGNFDPPVAGESVASDPAVVSLLGTPEDDVLKFTAGPTPGSWTVILNGVTQGEASGSAITVEFDGLEGKDTVIVTGTSGVDTARLWPHHGTVVGENYVVALANVDSVTVHGGGGDDVADLRDDPAGKDTFQSWPDQAKLYGDGFFNRVTSFRFVHAFSTAGNEDMAVLHDDPNATDTFKFWAGEAKLYGDGFYNRAKGFSQVHAFSSPGNDDVAVLYDDPNGDETFKAWPEEAKLYGDGFFNRAKGFRWVHAYATGGNDVAHLYGSAAKDTLVATSAQTRIFSSEYFNRAVSFDRVYAHGGDDQDVAILYDAVLETGLTQRPVPAQIESILWLYEFEDLQRRNDPDDGGDSETEAVDELFTAYWL